MKPKLRTGRNKENNLFPTIISNSNSRQIKLIKRTTDETLEATNYSKLTNTVADKSPRKVVAAFKTIINKTNLNFNKFSLLSSGSTKKDIPIQVKDTSTKKIKFSLPIKSTKTLHKTNSNISPILKNSSNSAQKLTSPLLIKKNSFSASFFKKPSNKSIKSKECNDNNTILTLGNGRHTISSIKSIVKIKSKNYVESLFEDNDESLRSQRSSLLNENDSSMSSFNLEGNNYSEYIKTLNNRLSNSMNISNTIIHKKESLLKKTSQLYDKFTDKFLLKNKLSKVTKTIKTINLRSSILEENLGSDFNFEICFTKMYNPYIKKIINEMFSNSISTNSMLRTINKPLTSYKDKTTLILNFTKEEFLPNTIKLKPKKINTVLSFKLNTNNISLNQRELECFKYDYNLKIKDLIELNLHDDDIYIDECINTMESPIQKLKLSASFSEIDKFKGRRKSIKTSKLKNNINKTCVNNKNSNLNSGVKTRNFNIDSNNVTSIREEKNESSNMSIVYINPLSILQNSSLLAEDNYKAKIHKNSSTLNCNVFIPNKGINRVKSSIKISELYDIQNKPLIKQRPSGMSIDQLIFSKTLNIKINYVKRSNFVERLFFYIKEKNLNAFRIEFEKGKGVPDLVNPDTKETLLISAVISQDINIVEFLLEKGSNIDCCDSNGNTAFHHAALLRNYNLMDLLIKRNVNQNLTNLELKTAWALLNGLITEDVQQVNK